MNDKRLILSLVAVPLVDQLVKWLVRENGGFWTLNRGIAFSIGANWQWIEWLVLGTLGVLGIWYYVLGMGSRKSRVEEGEILDTRSQILGIEALALGLILGGAISNLIDRMWWGGVVDYLRIDPFGWGLPVFNLGDVGICVGVGIWTWLRLKNRSTK